VDKKQGYRPKSFRILDGWLKVNNSKMGNSLPTRFSRFCLKSETKGFEGKLNSGFNSRLEALICL